MDPGDPQQTVDYVATRVPRLKARVRRTSALALGTGFVSCALYVAGTASPGVVLLTLAVCYFGAVAIKEVCNLYIDTLIYQRREAMRQEERQFEVDYREGWLRRAGDLPFQGHPTGPVVQTPSAAP